MTSQTPIFDQLVDEFNKSGVYEFGFVYENEPRAASQGPTFIDVPESISRDGVSFLANLGEALAQEEPEGEPTAEMDVVVELKDIEPSAIRYGVVYSDSILRQNIQTPEQQREGAGVTNNTLYDATKLAVIKPAIPEMVKLPHQPSDTTPEPDEDATVVLDNKVVDDLIEERQKDHGENWVAPRIVRSVSEELKQADSELGLDDFDKAFEEADRVLEPQTMAIVTLPKKVTPLQVAEFKRKMAETNPTAKVEQELPRRRNKRNNRNRNQSRSGATANKAA